MTVRETVDARKESLSRAQALAVARSAKRLVVAKGAKVVSLDLAKDRPSDDALAELVIGRTGGLRAPSIRVGDALYVGFNAETFRQTFG